MSVPPLPFDSLPGLAAGLALAAVAVGVARFRRVALPGASALLGTVGLLLLALAAGSPVIRRPVAGEVAVLVDRSASTRGATYRDRAALDRRLRRLLGDAPYRLYAFAGGDPVPDVGGELVDLPGDRTVFAPPPAAAAVLLFSDGRFAPPAAAPPVYAVVDPGLAAAGDARVASLRVEGGEAVAAVESTSPPRTLGWVGTTPAAGPDAVGPGAYVLRRAAAATAADPVAARLSPGDRWPENDALTIRPPPPARAERWFVTAGRPAPPGFRAIDPADLPADPAAYLAAAVVVLDNVPAGALSPAARDRLTRHVRDLGGGLVIVGGDRAFAAGGYANTPLDAVSPLASAPPRPAAHWVLLTDGSGSMNAPAGDGQLGGGGGGGTRWQAAAAALVGLLPALPPDDPVDLGSFAERVAWWSAGRPSREARGQPLPPPGVSPRGPTNLRPAIEEAAARHDPTLPGHLLLLSDADAEVGDVPSLAALLAGRNVKLHLLAVAGGRGLGDLLEVARRTGGRVVRQDDAARWATAAAELLRAAGDARLVAGPAAVTFAGPLAAVPARRVAPWNRTWLKPAATELATTTRDDGPVPMAAVAQAGEGRAAAVAFAATAAEVEALAGLVARPPRDPRVGVTWEAGSTLRVRVEAVDPAPGAAEPFLNGRPFTLDLTPDGGLPQRYPVPQVAPGRYELELPAPARPALAAVRDAGRAVERFAVAGRYPPEFEAVGVDRDALARLAARTGGRVVEPGEDKPIEFRWPRREIDLTGWFAAAGAAAIAGALVWWRRG